MRAGLPKGSRKRLASASVLAMAVTGLVVPLAGAAQAAVSAVTILTNPTPDTVRPFNNATNFQVFTNAPVGDDDVKAIVLSGPDQGYSTAGHPGYDVGCKVTAGAPVAPYLAVDQNHPVCTITNSSLRGPGVDAIRIFADKDANGAFTAGEPSVVVHATFIGNPYSMTLNGPSSAAQGACAIFITRALDSVGQPIRNGNGVKVRLTQGNATAADNLDFCSDGPASAPNSTSAKPPYGIVVGTFTQNAAGDVITFGVRSLRAESITVTSFVDNSPADNQPSPGEPVTASTLSLTPGLAPGAPNSAINAASTITNTLDSQAFDTGGGADNAHGYVVLRNAQGDLIQGAPADHIRISVTGANPKIDAQINKGAPGATTDYLGRLKYSYTAPNAGTDTVTAYVDYSNSGTQNVHDATEPTGTDSAQLVDAPGSAVGVDLIAVGTAAGGKTKSATEPTASNSVLPVSQHTETYEATVSDSVNHIGQSGLPVLFILSPGGTSAYLGNGFSPDALHAVVRTDANGKAVMTATSPNSAPGDAIRVAAVLGNGKADAAYTLYQSPTLNAVTTADNYGFTGSSFGTSQGSVTISPAAVVTAVHSFKAFTTTVADQFGTPVPNVNTEFFTGGRNAVGPFYANSDSAGKAVFGYLDSGPTGDVTGTDTTVGIADTNASGSANAGEAFGQGSRTYSASAPAGDVVAAIEGGIGAATNQFSGSSAPYSPVTSDDNATRAVNVTAPRSTHTPVDVFFQLRNADNSLNFSGRAVDVTTGTIGDIVSGSGNVIGPKSQTLTVASDGFIRLTVLSIQTGVQTITATADGVSKQLTITWTNAGAGRYVNFTPNARAIVTGQPTPVTVTVTDVWGNPVPGQSLALTLSGPATFGNGTTATSGVTDATGSGTPVITASQSGTVTVTATGSGAQFAAPADTPESGKAAGKPQGTAVLTASTSIYDMAASTVTISPVAPATTDTISLRGVLKDTTGAVVPNQRVRFILSGATSYVSPVIFTDSNGAATTSFQSAHGGQLNVRFSVVDSGGVEQAAKVVTFNIDGGSLSPRPSLSQSNTGGRVTLTLRTESRFGGNTVYFFRRSGITGVVVPLGTAIVDSNGVAIRIFDAARGGILALYGKVLGTSNIESPYSNDVHFKVN